MMDELKACPFCGSSKVFVNCAEYVKCTCGASNGSDADWNTRPIEDALRAENEQLRVENSRLAGLLLDEKSQLEIATDLGNKRWIALNDIYENGEKHNANWCKRRAGEAIGGNNG